MLPKLRGSIFEKKKVVCTSIVTVGFCFFFHQNKRCRGRVARTNMPPSNVKLLGLYILELLSSFVSEKELTEPSALYAPLSCGGMTRPR